MALKAVHVSDVPNLDQVAENAAALAVYSPWLAQGLGICHRINYLEFKKQKRKEYDFWNWFFFSLFLCE